MRTQTLGHVLLLLVVGCGGPARSTPGDGAIGDRDSAVPATDGAPVVDAGVATDGGPVVDASATPELCTGGLDEDRDLLVDCADSDCWSDAMCIASDVASVVPGLVACGDLIVLDATAAVTACTAIGVPMGSTTPTDCSVSLEATARVFCDVTGAAAALWIEERLSAPETNEMLSARRFQLTHYQRASVLDWERQQSGASTREGSTGVPIHDGSGVSGVGTNFFRVITIRPVLSGDSISRLLGMEYITTVIDLDLPMSTDTRSPVHLGGLMITVPVL